MIGTLDEAKEIYEAISKAYVKERNVETSAPEGWSYIGSGSSRMCFQSPSGTVYKIERYADEDYNIHEQVNFDHIRKNVALPEGWRIPESTLHQFEAITYKYTGWNRPPEAVQAVVNVIALEFVKGEPISYSDEDLRAQMRRGMDTIGMIDGARGNVLKTKDGFCIVDAGEEILPESAYGGVQFAKIGVAV